MVGKEGGFASIGVLTLGLGIGATSAVLSLIQGVLLTPPPYRRPQQLVLISSARTDGQQMTRPRGWPAAQWMEWQKEAKSFEAIAAYAWSFNFLVSADGSESLQGMAVTKDSFRPVGFQAQVGPTFLQGRNGAAAGPEVFPGLVLWRRQVHRERKNRAHAIALSPR